MRMLLTRATCLATTTTEHYPTTGCAGEQSRMIIDTQMIHEDRLNSSTYRDAD